MSTVKFPAVLRANVGGIRETQVDGATIGQVLDALSGTYPALRDQLFTPDGELNGFINIYVNGQDVRYLDGRDTPVADGDEVRLLPAMAGGASRRSRSRIVHGTGGPR
jgi:molybdopterin synthase sulfur carrier subunit